MKRSIIISLLLMVGISLNAQKAEFPRLTGPYLGQKPPGSTPQQFLAEIITEQVHSTAVFSPHGDEVYWTPMGIGKIRFMKVKNGFWTQPQFLSLGGSTDAKEPCFSPDGNRLYFISLRAPKANGYIHKKNIWHAERTSDGWSDPVLLPPVINDLDLQWLFSIANSGNLYFAGHPIGQSDTNDIYCVEFEKGRFARRHKLSETINTAGHEDTPFIAPDESYLIFTRAPADFAVNANLYISFRNEDGTWREAVEMKRLSTSEHELAPHVSPDGMYLFFVSFRTGKAKPYWVSADIIDEYR